MLAANLPVWVEQVKFLLAVGGAFWAAFGAYTFVKSSLTETQKDVKEVKIELANQTTAIVSATDKQTNELRSMSADVRMLVQSMIAPPRARAARAARRKK